MTIEENQLENLVMKTQSNICLCRKKAFKRLSSSSLGFFFCVLLVFIVSPVYSADYPPEEDAYPWEVVSKKKIEIKKRPMKISKVLCEIPEGTSLIAIKRLSKWTKVLFVDSTGVEIKGYTRSAGLSLVQSVAETHPEIKAKDDKERIFSIIKWIVGVILVLGTAVCCYIFGQGIIQDIGISVLTTAISLSTVILFGLLPPALILGCLQNSMLWLAILLTVVYVVVLLVAFFRVDDVTSVFSFTFYSEIINMIEPVLISIIIIFFTHWMETWKEVTTFWPGVGVWLISLIIMIISAIYIKSGIIVFFRSIMDLDFISLINSVAFVLLGVLMFTCIIGAATTVCLTACVLSVIGLLGGFKSGGRSVKRYDSDDSDYPLTINGESAREISYGEYETKSGVHYHDEDDGFGRVTKRGYRHD